MDDLPEPYILGWHTPDPFTVCTHCKKVGQRVDTGVPDVPTVVFVLGATCLLSPFLRSAPCTHGSCFCTDQPLSGTSAGGRMPQVLAEGHLSSQCLAACAFTSGNSVVLPLLLRLLGNAFGSSHFLHETISFLWSTVRFWCLSQNSLPPGE